MIDTRGYELHEILMSRIAREEEEADRTVSPQVVEAMRDYDIYMNKLNDTEGLLYDKKGEVIMEMEGADDEHE